jgi:hypothetical protein
MDIWQKLFLGSQVFILIALFVHFWWIARTLRIQKERNARLEERNNTLEPTLPDSPSPNNPTDSIELKTIDV